MKKAMMFAIATLAMVSTVGAAEVVYDEAVELKPAPAPAAAADADAQVRGLIEGDMNGVVRIKKGADGEIKSLIVIGRARIEPTMDPAEAKMYASDAAMTTARAHFVTWMKTQVAMVKTSSDNVAVYSKNDGTAKSRGSEVTRLTQQQVTETAEGMVSGLEQIASATYEGMYVMVLGWDASTVRAVAGMNAPKAEPPKGPKPQPRGGNINEQPIRVHVEKDAAQRFL